MSTNFTQSQVVWFVFWAALGLFVGLLTGDFSVWHTAPIGGIIGFTSRRRGEGLAFTLVSLLVYLGFVMIGASIF